MRSNQYDVLEQTVKTLKARMIHHEETLVKADQNDMLSLSECRRAASDVDWLCKSAYNQFSALRRDYRHGLINPVRYKDHLKPLHDLLTSGDKKIGHPDLHPEEIASELKKFFS